MRLMGILLCLPHSSAEHWRAFSMLRKVKTRLHQLLNLKTLNSLLPIRMNEQKLYFWCVTSQRIAWGRWESYCYLEEGAVFCKLHASVQAAQHSSSKLQTKLCPEWTGCRFGNEVLIPTVIKILTSFNLVNRKILIVYFQVLWKLR